MKKLTGSMITTSALFLLFGVFLLVAPGQTLTGLCYTLAFILAAVGVTRLFSYFTTDKTPIFSQLQLLFGIIMLGLGAFVFFFSEVVVSALPILFGIFIGFDSIFRLQNALQLRRYKDKSWAVMLGFAVLSLVFAGVLIFFAFETMELLVRVIGIFLIIEGALNAMSVVYTKRAFKRFSEQNPEQKDKIEKAYNIDIDGDGFIGGGNADNIIEGTAKELDED